MRSSDRTTKSHFRTDRMFSQNGQWYFNTRGGEVIGPFGDELEASTQLEVYMRLADSGLLPEASAHSLESSKVGRAG